MTTMMKYSLKNKNRFSKCLKRLSNKIIKNLIVFKLFSSNNKILISKRNKRLIGNLVNKNSRLYKKYNKKSKNNSNKNNNNKQKLKNSLHNNSKNWIESYKNKKYRNKKNKEKSKRKKLKD